MHSGSENFSHGRSSMGTRMGQTFTQSRQVAFVQCIASLFRPRKLNRFSNAKSAPCGHRYRHHERGTYTASPVTTPRITMRAQKSSDSEAIPPRIAEYDCSTRAYLKSRAIFGMMANRVSAGLKKLKGASPNSPKALR